MGMVRRPPTGTCCSTGSPHVRGDGPSTARLGAPISAFSPRAWGWSGEVEDLVGAPSVLPTCVGMVRSMKRSACSATSSPHVRGDGPGAVPSPVAEAAFSPRAWGWSAPQFGVCDRGDVLPTCVGMVRRACPRNRRRYCSPHVRGDGPVGQEFLSFLGEFSPRAWGWSATVVMTPGTGTVLPTCVGMVRPD